MTRVKICGVTTVEESIAVASAGVAAIGLNFADSPRHVELDKACEIAWATPPFVAKVGVFVNADEGFMREAFDACLDYVQLHGDESLGVIDRLANAGMEGRIIKALHMSSEEDIEKVGMYDRACAVLLDARMAGKRGGTGKTIDWELARKATDKYGKVILAGGITPENVAEAVRTVRPYAVDIASGVESAPGKKDMVKVYALFREIRKAEC
ncbi:N-(5'-phosphoribosyl)anthranilate isomerase [Candidatus Hydrogenedentota bacterium]